MKDKKPSSNLPQGEQHHIPDIEIIDLDAESGEYGEDPMSSEEFEEAYHNHKSRSDHRKNNSGNFLSRINIHIVLLVVTIAFIAGIAYKISNWGIRIDLDEIKNREDDEDYLSLLNAYDNFLPLINADGTPVYMDYGEDSTILVFGNSPFADSRDSEDNLANMIHDMTGATVYNCAINDSYLAAGWPYLSVADFPHDAFNFYWLCTLALGDSVDNAYLSAVEVLGDNAPPEAMEVYNTLKSIDLSTVDVITIMYDGTDYLAGHRMYNENNKYDIQFFTGNLVAGIEMIRENYPNIRFIVMSPTYAYGIDDDGNYISSDIQTYGEGVLSTYVILQYSYCYDLSVTFIDHIYGTITEDNASDYLLDHFHLNVEGRKRVAERFVKALQYFSELAATSEPTAGE